MGETAPAPEAEPFLRHALAVQRRYPPAGTKELPGTLVDLATVLAETGRAKEAAPLVEEAVERLRITYGMQSAEFADALNALGNLQLAAGDRAAAEIAYRRGIEIHRKLIPGHFPVVNTLENLVSLLIQQGQLDEAESLLREAETRCQNTVGDTNLTYANIRGIFGYLQFLKGNYHAVAPELRKVVDALGRVYPKGDPNVVAAEVLLGLALTRDGMPADGEPYLRDALQTGDRGSSESFGVVENVDEALGECLLTQKRYDEAEPLLRGNYDGLQSLLGEQNPRTVGARQQLEQLHQALNEPPDSK